jgi:hypothetical protein
MEFIPGRKLKVVVVEGKAGLSFVFATFHTDILYF